MPSLSCLIAAFRLLAANGRWRHPHRLRVLRAYYRLARYLAGHPRRGWQVKTDLDFWEREAGEYGNGVAMSVLVTHGPEALAAMTAEYRKGEGNEPSRPSPA